ncbi:MAG: T9SS type A sorting domain-containing protein, partial [Deltaproteobacteria bacterium]
PTTKITFYIPQLSFVSVKVFDVLGNEIANLVNEEKAAGIYEINFNSNNLSSGIYFYQLRAGSFVETKKMLLLR